MGNHRQGIVRQVSIHAPAWGATCDLAGITRDDMFRSTPPRGGRLGWTTSGANCVSFDPRPRVGGDNMSGCSAPAIDVSIHAPAWGATKDTVLDREIRIVSIHAPAWGATPHNIPRHRSLVCFDPRPRVGGDMQDRIVEAKVIVSIHAPAWGATLARLRGKIASDVSIHAPAWGATLPGEGVHHVMRVSIHAPAWGATHKTTGI